MKMKIFLSGFSLVLFCFTALIFSSCEKENDATSPSETRNLYYQIYKDSTFLKVEGDLYDPKIIWGNVGTYMCAYNRMKAHLKLKNNQLVWDFESGEELRISENIFNYVTDAWKSQNKQLQSQKYKIVYKDTDYMIVPVKTSTSTPKVNTRSTSWLDKDDHAGNYSVLSNFMDDSYVGQNLGDLVELDESRFEGNGVGDVSMSGSFQYDERTVRTYYCCNACAWDANDKARCHLNYICQSDSKEENTEKYVLTWRWMRNSAQLPLISLSDRVSKMEH